MKLVFDPKENKDNNGKSLKIIVNVLLLEKCVCISQLVHFKLEQFVFNNIC